MDLSGLLPLVVFGGGFSLVGAVLYGAWMLGRYRGREEQAPLEMASLEARLARLEQVTMVAASSIDRLEAAHRLTARLLTETPMMARPSTPPTTPH